jgi:hypothetical protein
MNLPFIDLLPMWLVFLATIALALFSLEVGYKLGRWRHSSGIEEKDAPVGAIVAAVLGLLAFMLAFTFGLAASRFDARRQVILEEANAIGTAYLRARLLPKPRDSEAARLLREYVDVRVRGVHERKIAEAAARSEALHEQLWEQATAAAEKNPTPITALFIQALNEVIDVHAKRMLVGTRSRIPLSIWVGLSVLAVIGMVSVGYQVGLIATRRSPAVILLVIAFAGVLVLIVDLDRPLEGYLRVSQQAMTDLQKSMHSPKP